MLEHVRAANSEERLRTVLQKWGERENVSRDDARRLFRLWGIREEIIERVVKAHPYPK